MTDFVTEPNDVPFDEEAGADEFPAAVRLPATGQFAYFGTFRAGLKDLADRTKFLKNAVDAIADADGGEGATLRNLAKAIYVDVGGTGTGNIENPYGTVGAAAAAAAGKLILVAPGDYSGDTAIVLTAGRTAIRGLTALPDVGSNADYNSNSVPKLPAISMALPYDGATVFEQVRFGGNITLAGNVTIRDCMDAFIERTSEQTLSLNLIRSTILGLTASTLNADECIFGDGVASVDITVQSSNVRITNCKIGAGSTITFTAGAGTLFIDLLSDANDFTVVNGTKVILGLAERGVAILSDPLTPEDSQIVGTLILPRGTGRWLIRAIAQIGTSGSEGPDYGALFSLVLEVSINGGSSWDVVTTSFAEYPPETQTIDVSLSLAAYYVAAGNFRMRLTAVFDAGTAANISVNQGVFSATPVNI